MDGANNAENRTEESEEDSKQQLRPAAVAEFAKDGLSEADQAFRRSSKHLKLQYSCPD